MAAKVYYDGQQRAAFIIEWTTRNGEPFIEVIITGFKVEKVIHANHIIETKTA